MTIRSARFLLVVCVLCSTAVLADDWPEFRGKGRLGVWKESGILETFPADGLKIRWRTPIKSGFAGPSVSNGSVFVLDFEPSAEPNKGTERALCLGEKTGKILWTREWPVDNTGLMRTYAIGPRATPTVDGDRVYTLGAKGALHCLNARTGEVIWKKDYVADYGTQVPTWGMTAAPVVDGPRLIALVGGAQNAKVVAFDKMTGKEIWRALDSESEPGYCQPFLLQAGGVRQVIIWHPRALASLDPESGRLLWEEPFKIQAGMTLATPVPGGLRLLVSSFYNGSLMMELDAAKPTARELWRGKSSSEISTDGLHSVVSTPVIDGDYIYGICSYGQFRCLRAKTGERVWETLDVTREKARWASGFIVRHGDRYFINNDRGELIIAKLSPEGYQEISRTQLIKPTARPGNRRELTYVNWSHPAYANRHIFARNDEEIICASLEAR